MNSRLTRSSIHVPSQERPYFWPPLQCALSRVNSRDVDLPLGATLDAAAQQSAREQRDAVTAAALRIADLLLEAGGAALLDRDLQENSWVSECDSLTPLFPLSYSRAIDMSHRLFGCETQRLVAGFERPVTAPWLACCHSLLHGVVTEAAPQHEAVRGSSVTVMGRAFATGQCWLQALLLPCPLHGALSQLLVARDQGAPHSLVVPHMWRTWPMVHVCTPLAGTKLLALRRYTGERRLHCKDTCLTTPPPPRHHSNATMHTHTALTRLC